MEITLNLTKEELGRLKDKIESLVGKSYMAEDLEEGKFYERLLQQLEREMWK